MSAWVARVRGDDGVATFSFIVILILMMSGIAFTMFLGRVVLLGTAVNSAAEEGARAASLEQTTFHAERIGTSAVEFNLSTSREANVPCQNLSIGFETADDGDGNLRPGSHVTTGVSCTVYLSDLTWATFLPGTFTASATATERVDIFRGTEPGS
jgi:Flp pilus assembly protein TadG